MKHIFSILTTLLLTFSLFGQDGDIDTSYPPTTNVGGSVKQSILVGTTDAIFVGDFTSYAGQTVNRIVKISQDGVRNTAFNCSANDIIYTIAQQPDGKFIIGGSFTTINGSAMNRLARINADGTLDNTFSVGSGFDHDVNGIDIQPDGKILVVGKFMNYRDVTASRIVRLNANGTTDNTFITGTGFNGDAKVVRVNANGDIVVGGAFTAYKGISASRIIRLTSDGSIVTSFTASFNNYVNDIHFYEDGKMLVGGEFTELNGATCNRFCKLNVVGTLEPYFTLGTGFNSTVQRIAVHANRKIYLVGNFTTYNGTNAKGIIRLFESGGRDVTFVMGSGFYNAPEAIHIMPNGRVFLGGLFLYSYNGINIGNIVKLNGCPAAGPSVQTPTLINNNTQLYSFNSVHSVEWYTCNGMLVPGAQLSTLTAPPGSYFIRVVDECGYASSSCVTIPNCVVERAQVVNTCASSYTWRDGQTYTANNNTATHLIPNVAANGCDSLIRLDLTFSGTVAPTPIVANLPTLTHSCTDITLAAPTATNACGTVNTGVNVTTEDYTAVGTHTIQWKYDTGLGGISFQNQTLIVTDNVAPVPTIANLSPLTAGCQLTAPTAPTAQDNCAGVVTGTTTSSFPITGLGNHTITWTYSDGNGNTSTQTQLVTITDGGAPVPTVQDLPNVVAQCNVLSLTAPTASHPCGTVTGVHNANLPLINQGTHTITWTYTSTSGATSTQQQTIIINDDVAPVPNQGQLPDLLRFCDVTSLQAPTASDNCMGNISATTTTTFPITAIGTTVVTWVYNDGNGNQVTQDQNIIISSFSNMVTNVNGTLEVQVPDAIVYQWLDCANNNAPIPGATSYSFTPSVSGEYAVNIFKDGCSVTSDCFTISNVGVHEVNLLNYQVYPNPTTGYLTIDFGSMEEGVQLEIIDNAGRLIYANAADFTSQMNVQFGGEPGVYHLKVRTSNGQFNKRIVLN